MQRGQTLNFLGQERDYREEQRTVGYHLVYRYNGETYTTRMDSDPGALIRLRLTVTAVS